MLLEKGKTYNLSLKLELKETEKEPKPKLNNIQRLVENEGPTLNIQLQTDNVHVPKIDFKSVVISPTDPLVVIDDITALLERYCVTQEQLFYEKLVATLNEIKNELRKEQDEKDLRSNRKNIII